MAEVEKMTAAPPTDTPVSSPNVSETGGVGGGSSSAAEYGTSPTQERSSNSHPHDSEYDTASDLEGGEDYDDDDDESISDEETETEDDDAGSESEDDDLGSETMSGNENALDRSVDSEAQKKVDEDRSNPQYIPKRGTFYEHDDRTAETEGEVVVEQIATPSGSETAGEVNGVISTGATPTAQTPTISQASKTMKKWQPASGVERWSHDRFDASEQAPKSRSELLQTYGYDIRTEEAAPRARRRRRYGRGPMKYSRNWEDVQAYLKASNKERKLPRPQDFPALNERASSTKVRRPRTSSSKEEKENRGERRAAQAANIGERQHNTSGGSGVGGSGALPPKSQEPRERDHKNRRYGRVNGGPVGPSGRQNAMEFKPKTNRGPAQRGEHRERERERERDRDYVDHRSEREQHKNATPRSNAHHAAQSKQAGDVAQHNQQQQQQHVQHHVHHQQQKQHQVQQSIPQGQQQQQQPQQQHMQQQQPTISQSNLSQRLQQVQQRNDPSHVGSVQMHALATQNQQQMHISQQQQLPHQQQAQPQQQPQTLPAEQRNAPKRYSSQRRSQQEATQQHLVEQHQIQQLQLQQAQQQQQVQQQQQQQQSQLMLQDPHVLMQIYQQQELQVQLQTLQLGPAPPNAVPQQPKQHPPPAAYPQTQAAPYYVTGAEPVPQTTYVAPAPAAYLPTPPAAVAYAQSAVTQPPQAPSQAQPAPQPAQPQPSINYHQNYNTVGGTTYFVPPAQTSTRPAVLPQRRPTNAIPILPPSEKHKSRSAAAAANASLMMTQAASNTNIPKADEAPIGSAENIDHIIDNMFVQRPAFQPPTSSASAGSTQPANEAAAAVSKPIADDPNSNVGASVAEQSHQTVAAAGQE